MLTWMGGGGVLGGSQRTVGGENEGERGGGGCF